MIFSDDWYPVLLESMLFSWFFFIFQSHARFLRSFDNFLLLALFPIVFCMLIDHRSDIEHYKKAYSSTQFRWMMIGQSWNALFVRELNHPFLIQKIVLNICLSVSNLFRLVFIERPRVRARSIQQVFQFQFPPLVPPSVRNVICTTCDGIATWPGAISKRRATPSSDVYSFVVRLPQMS